VGALNAPRNHCWVAGENLSSTSPMCSILTHTYDSVSFGADGWRRG
jgi:hypothetical protein